MTHVCTRTSLKYAFVRSRVCTKSLLGRFAPPAFAYLDPSATRESGNRSAAQLEIPANVEASIDRAFSLLIEAANGALPQNKDIE